MHIVEMYYGKRRDQWHGNYMAPPCGIMDDMEGYLEVVIDGRTYRTQQFFPGYQRLPMDVITRTLRKHIMHVIEDELFGR